MIPSIMSFFTTSATPLPILDANSPTVIVSGTSISVITTGFGLFCGFFSCSNLLFGWFLPKRLSPFLFLFFSRRFILISSANFSRRSFFSSLARSTFDDLVSTVRLFFSLFTMYSSVAFDVSTPERSTRTPVCFLAGALCFFCFSFFSFSSALRLAFASASAASRAAFLASAFAFSSAIRASSSAFAFSSASFLAKASAFSFLAIA